MSAKLEMSRYLFIVSWISEALRRADVRGGSVCTYFPPASMRNEIASIGGLQ